MLHAKASCGKSSGQTPKSKPIKTPDLIIRKTNAEVVSLSGGVTKRLLRLFGQWVVTQNISHEKMDSILQLVETDVNAVFEFTNPLRISGTASPIYIVSTTLLALLTFFMKYKSSEAVSVIAKRADLCLTLGSIGADWCGVITCGGELSFAHTALANVMNIPQYCLRHRLLQAICSSSKVPDLNKHIYDGIDDPSLYAVRHPVLAKELKQLATNGYKSGTELPSSVLDICKLLLKFGADPLLLDEVVLPSFITEIGWIAKNALVIAIENGYVDIVKLLVEHVGLDQKACIGLSLRDQKMELNYLMLAAYSGEVAIAEYFLRRGFDPNFSICEGIVALYCAVVLPVKANVAMVKLLLDYGALPILSNQLQVLLPAMFALNPQLSSYELICTAKDASEKLRDIISGFTQRPPAMVDSILLAIDKCLAEGANPAAYTNMGVNTVHALMYFIYSATSEVSADVFTMLTKMVNSVPGNYINCVFTPSNLTFLEYAINADCVFENVAIKVLQVLLQHPNIDVNFTNPTSLQNPLTQAIVVRKNHLIRLLLERGAKVNCQCVLYQSNMPLCLSTALDVAVFTGNIAAVELILQWQVVASQTDRLSYEKIAGSAWAAKVLQMVDIEVVLRSAYVRLISTQDGNLGSIVSCHGLFAPDVMLPVNLAEFTSARVIASDFSGKKTQNTSCL